MKVQYTPVFDILKYVHFFILNLFSEKDIKRFHKLIMQILDLTRKLKNSDIYIINKLLFDILSE